MGLHDDKSKCSSCEGDSAPHVCPAGGSSLTQKLNEGLHPPSQTQPPIPPTTHYDVCILGAGPAGLSVLSALQQPEGILKTESVVSDYVHDNNRFGLKGHKPGSSEITLIKEADYSHSGVMKNTSAF